MLEPEAGGYGPLSRDRVHRTKPSGEGPVEVKVIEDYRGGYAPPFDVASSITELLGYIPPLHLRLLGQIVLTNASGLDTDRSSKATDGPSPRVGQALGRYHPFISGGGGIPSKPAWIEIFIDNVANHSWNLFTELLVPVLGPSVRLAETLYHEIGHHIHCRLGQDLRNAEKHAERWAQKLYRRFVFGKHLWLGPLILPVFLLGWAWHALVFSETVSRRRQG